MRHAPRAVHSRWEPWVWASAFVCRAAYVAYHPPEMMAFERLTDQIAVHLAAGRGFTYDGTTPFFYPPPLYPFLVSLLYRAGGHHPYLVPAAQILLDVGTLGLAVRLARKAFGEKVALVSGVLIAFEPQLWTFCSRLFVENLQAFLTTAFCLLWLSAEGERRNKLWAAAGLVLGLLNLVKPITLLLPAGMLAWSLARRSLGPNAPGLAVCGALSVAVLLPWTLRNRAASGGRFILVSSGMGTPFLHGTIQEWRGTLPPPKEGPLPPETKLPYPYGLQPEDDDRFGREGLRKFAEDPLAWASLWPAKLAAFWIGNRVYLLNDTHSPADAARLEAARRGRPLAALALAKRWLWVPVQVALALFGLWSRRRDWKDWLPLGLLPAYFSALYLLFVVESFRYDIPVLPLALIWTAAGVDELYRRARA